MIRDLLLLLVKIFKTTKNKSRFVVIFRFVVISCIGTFIEKVYIFFKTVVFYETFVSVLVI